MTIINFDCYHADLEYRDGEGVCKSITIDFQAHSVSDAAQAVQRFFNCRKAQIPEFFGELLAVKIFPRTIGHIDGKGNLLTRLGIQLFEWKIDMGWTYEQRIDRAKAWEERSRRPGVI